MPMNASDPCFDVFYDFEEYLLKTFPVLYVCTAAVADGEPQDDEVRARQCARPPVHLAGQQSGSQAYCEYLWQRNTTSR